jgi:REP element-mobilizing transposase RayT
MARPLRIEFEGALYHVTSRGNERKDIFQDDLDRITFLDILNDVKDRFNWFCHSYCLMNNHYHLIIETPEGNLSIGMRQLNGVYTQTYNKRHNRVGHLFQGRYKAILIEKESHLLEVCRYVVLNPVRAGLTNDPQEWRWSSFRSLAGYEKPHPCLTREWVIGQFSLDIKEAEKRYVEFVKDGIKKESIWKDLKHNVLLGREEFVDRFEIFIKVKGRIKEIPKNQRNILRPALKEIFSEDVLKSKKLRDEKIIDAIKSYGYYQSEIAEFLQMHYSTVSRIIKRGIQKNNAAPLTCVCDDL